MNCEKCFNKPATVHVQHNINGEMQQLHLCAECAAQQDMALPNFNNLMQGFIDSFLSQHTPPASRTQPETELLTCPVCQLSYPQFKSSGRLGCAQCYEIFAQELAGIFKNVQAGNTHQGKVPQKAGEDILQKRRLEDLKQQMQQAIAREAFEEAAGLRDEIRSLTIQMENQGGERNG